MEGLLVRTKAEKNAAKISTLILKYHYLNSNKGDKLCAAKIKLERAQILLDYLSTELSGHLQYDNY
ncbi:hypothetical protein T10_4110 [Trichinella papuae]|uniref:Uncharacterized protein n=1 Tax=Trichinella papuae TaxID=268474 RepID=A0A0V1MI37_9BILA|nr:hypothetical protein T10_4110 [Trichinella papuae]